MSREERACVSPLKLQTRVLAETQAPPQRASVTGREWQQAMRVFDAILGACLAPNVISCSFFCDNYQVA